MVIRPFAKRAGFGEEVSKVAVGVEVEGNGGASGSQERVGKTGPSKAVVSDGEPEQGIPHRMKTC